MADIVVDAAILHIIREDDSKTRVLSPSHGLLPLNRNPRARDYLAKHITNSLKDDTAKAASFDNLAVGSTGGICLAIAADPSTLVAASTQLAERLHAIVAKDRRIDVGDLAVCLFRDGHSPGVSPCLALLKMDPSEAFRHTTITDEHQNQINDLTVETDILPTSGLPLQKCALVQPLDPRPSYDMLLVDRQTVQTGPITIAKFFVGDFLGAMETYDPRKRTNILHRKLVEVKNRVSQRLTRDQQNYFQSAVNLALTSSAFSLDTFLNNLPMEDEIISEIENIITDGFPDRTFDIDPAFAAKLNKKVVYQGSHGLKLEVLSEYKADIIKEVLRPDQSVGRTYWQIIIQSDRWDEKS